ncbi:MAG: hypothetical protein FIA94_13070 [Nitrospirae bacterium]|nr:hypothetical protein [Nitrospirota bacterium]
MKRNRLLLLAVPVIIILACLLAVQRYSAVRKDLDAVKEEEALKDRTLRKYVALIAERPDLEKKAAQLKELRKANDTNLLEGQTIAIVAASLQDAVRTIVTSHGGTVASERAGKTEDREPFKVITVTIDTVLPDARALADVLYAIETRTPYLIVRDLDVRVRNMRAPKELSVRLDIAALTATR